MFDVRAKASTLQNFKIALLQTFKITLPQDFKIALLLFIEVFILREQGTFTIPLRNFPHD